MHLFMRIFTRLTASCLVIVIAASLVSCTTGQGGHTSAGLSISLTSDKDAIFADGADAVTFTVIDNSSREDVTSASVIYMLSEDGSSSQTSASFSTENPGSYTFYAEYSGVRSAEISITAHGENAEGITLHVSKNSIYNDGGDFTVITLTDADGNDVTELGTFYANGEQLEDNLFSTTIGSLAPVEISAAIGYSNRHFQLPVRIEIPSGGDNQDQLPILSDNAAGDSGACNGQSADCHSIQCSQYRIRCLHWPLHFRDPEFLHGIQ